MAETEGNFTRARLEAFSDGVIAVIITIMVLDLKAPTSASPEELVSLWPSFSVYLVSYLFVAIYWINHHSLLAQAERATPLLIWSNSLLLFFLSLIPFSTAYVANTHLAALPMALYGGVQFLCGLGFAATLSVIVRDRRGETEFQARAVARVRKNLISLAAYALGVVVAFINPMLSLAIYLGVSIAYVVPGLFEASSDRPPTR